MLTRIRVALLLRRAAWDEILRAPSTARCVAEAERTLALVRGMPDPPATLVARAAMVLARRLRQAGRIDEAAERAREAVLAAGDGPATVRVAALSLWAQLLLDLGRPEESLAAAESAVATCRTAPRRSARLARQLCLALYLQSVILAELGRHEDALSAGEQALAVMASVPRHRSLWVLQEHWRVQSQLVELIGRAGRPEEAVAAGTRLLERMDGALTRADPIFVLPYRARLRAYLAMCHEQLGHLDQAEVLAGQSVAQYRALGESHREHLAWSLALHAKRLAALGRHREADAAWGEAATIYGELADADPARFRGAHVNALGGRADALWDSDQEASVAASVAALPVVRRYAADDPDAFAPHLVILLAVTAGRAATVGRGDALALADEAVRVARGLASGPAAQVALARALHNRAVVLCGRGSRTEAIESLREAVALRRRLAEADAARYAPDLMASVELLGTLLHDLSRYEEAVELWGDAAAFLRPRAAAGGFDGDLAAAVHNLGLAYSALDRHDDGIAALTEAIGYRRRQADHGEHGDAALACALRQRSSDLAAIGRYAEARRDLDEAIAILRRLVEVDPDRYRVELERTTAQARRQSEAAARHLDPRLTKRSPLDELGPPVWPSRDTIERTTGGPEPGLLRFGNGALTDPGGA
jgi:tetratricopeptide (TPR) repeat protein